jgi:branched-chain amino acid transport system ATP-binding protein
MRAAGDVRLAASDLYAGYGRVPVVRGIDLEVRAGEVVALVGPNGAGKTTTLLALAGAIPVLRGTVSLDGQETTAPLHERARAGLALIPEQRAIFRRLDVHDNLKLGLGPVERAFAIAPELRPLASRPAGLLSGGEQQILVLARALAGSPRVIIADELSLGLAPRVVRRMLDMIRRAADDGAAALVVEQRLQNVLAVADRLVVLRRGTVELSGSAAELATRVDEIRAAYLARPAQDHAHQGGSV